MHLSQKGVGEKWELEKNTYEFVNYGLILNCGRPILVNSGSYVTLFPQGKRTWGCFAIVAEFIQS